MLTRWQAMQLQLMEGCASQRKGENAKNFAKNYVFIDLRDGSRMDVDTPTHKFREVLDMYNASCETEDDMLPYIRLLCPLRIAFHAIDHMRILQTAADRLAGCCNACIGKLPGNNAPVNAHIIRELAASLKDIVIIMRNVYDLPTEDQLTARQIALRRMALEEKRSEQEETDTEIRVIMSEEVRELMQ